MAREGEHWQLRPVGLRELLHRGGQLLETRLIEQDYDDLDVRQR